MKSMKTIYVKPAITIHEYKIVDAIAAASPGGTINGEYDQLEEEDLARMRYQAITGEEFGNLW